MTRRVRFSTSIALLAAIAALVAVGVSSPSAARRALYSSAILAAGTMAIALPIGMLLAVLITRFDLPGRRYAAAGLGVLLFLPLYVQLSGWEAALGKLGWYSLAYGSIGEPLLAGMRGAVFVHAMAAIPWAAFIVAIGLVHVDPAPEEAALLVAPPRVVLWRITLRQSVGFLVAAAVWIVIGTTSEMTVTNIYLINPGEWTYTERFYMAWARATDAAQATVAALPGVIGLAVMIGLSLWAVAQLSDGKRRPSYSRPVTLSCGGWQPVSAVAMWGLAILLLVVPLASLVAKAGFVVIRNGESRIPSWSLKASLEQLAGVPARFDAELWDTVTLAAGVASVVLLAAGSLGWIARGGGRWATPAMTAVVLGLAIPGPLVGAALIQLLNHDIRPAIPLSDGTAKSWLLVLYDDTQLAPLIAQAVRALPLATLLLWHSFATLDDDVLAAAALDGLSPLRVFWKIAVPQRWRAIAAAWIAAFAVAAGDLAWAHLVTPPGLDLLSRRVFGLVHSGVEEQVAAISLVNVLAYSALASVVLWLLAPPRLNRHDKSRTIRGPVG
jgi:iron(III) transport system permease protein